MIKIKFYSQQKPSRTITKTFDSFDTYLYWYFNDTNVDWMVEQIIEGKEIILGEN